MTRVPPTRGLTVGIDLGTTYSLVAVMDGVAPRTVALDDAVRLVPSAVGIDDGGQILVGAAARAQAAHAPERTVLAFKRDIGEERRYRLGSHSFSPVECAALMLRHLKENAEAALGAEIAEAVVTVPAYFGERQRRATQDAAKIAGLHVERIINEPTAAALAYGLHHRDREFRAVVLDLGGGTFDVTVLEVLEGVIEIQASSGDTRLGGEDFTDVVQNLLLRKLGEALGKPVGGDRIVESRVREAAEIAKCRLSVAQSVRVPLCDIGGKDLEVEVSREEVEVAWAPLLERLGVPIRQALRDAGAKPEDMDEVLLAGGATRMPAVRELVANLFGRLPLTELHPDEAVALGAAVQAALKSQDKAVGDLVVTDVAPFSLGIAASSEFGNQLVSGLFSPIIERGTVLPASRSRLFSTVVDGQRKIDVQVYQGEHSLCSDNRQLGKYVVDGLPKGPAGSEQIEVRFTYDLNGVLEVESTVLATGKRASLIIENTPGRLSKKDLAAALTKLQRLKFHPRDALPNVTALKRADALFRESRGAAREVLGVTISQFRAALQSQDPETIEQTRALLNQSMESMR